MYVEEKCFVSEGLKPGDIVTCELKLGTLLITRITPLGVISLLWSNGDNKMTIHSIANRTSFMDFVYPLAESHNCRLAVRQNTEDKISFELIAFETPSDHN